MAESSSILGYLENRRRLVVDEIRAMVPEDTAHTGGLYELMLDYPLRAGKAIRPALSISVCRGAGGSLSAVLPSAAVLELYHNAFLIHDDVEDLSEKRRSADTLNSKHGMPTAVNVGDGMLALAIRPLLDNISHIGLGKALRILRVIADMAQQTAEGQMIELDWIRTGRWTQRDADYIRLVHKKTAWYSFVAPMVVGAIAAGLDQPAVNAFGRLAIPLGVAFQIQDDVLNLTSEAGDYTKDRFADLWEGKHTLILIHALRMASDRERDKALAILRKPHPNAYGLSVGNQLGKAASSSRKLTEQIDALVESGDLTENGKQRLLATIRNGNLESLSPKTPDDIAVLRELISRHDSISFAWETALRHARHFKRKLRDLIGDWPASSHRKFLFELGEFTIHRTI